MTRKSCELTDEEATAAWNMAARNHVAGGDYSLCIRAVATAATRKALEHAALLVGPKGICPCDCRGECDCRNSGDRDRMVAWYEAHNNAEAIRKEIPDA